VCPALAHRANQDVVPHTATAAMPLAVTHGSAVEAEMFQLFVTVVGVSSWTSFVQIILLTPNVTKSG
jgi:hypothetical protein